MVLLVRWTCFEADENAEWLARDSGKSRTMDSQSLSNKPRRPWVFGLITSYKDVDSIAIAIAHDAEDVRSAELRISRHDSVDSSDSASHARFESDRFAIFLDRWN